MKQYPWEGQGAKLTDYDIPRLGHRIGVGEDEIHAVLDVETRGYGFDKHGVIRLFESHVFYRQLPPGKRAQALHLGLAHRTWAEAKKAGNYKDNYARLVQAFNFDAKAALESTSWGLGQIMGFNHKLAGYNSAFEMVEAFAKSEANQLEGMIEFIISASLDYELRSHNWAGFARGYNGSGYAANNYHTRLRQRYEWWAKKPDTKWTPASAAGEEMEAQTIKPTLSAPAPKNKATPVATAAIGATAVLATGVETDSSLVVIAGLLGIAVLLAVYFYVKGDDDE